MSINRNVLLVINGLLALVVLGCSGVADFEASRDEKIAEAGNGSDEDYETTEPVATTGVYLTVNCDPKVEDQNNMLYCTARDSRGSKISNSCLSDWNAKKSNSGSMLQGSILPDSAKYNASFNLASDDPSLYAVQVSGRCGTGIYNDHYGYFDVGGFNLTFAATYTPEYSNTVSGGVQSSTVGNRTPLHQVRDLCNSAGIISDQEFATLKSNAEERLKNASTIEQMAITTYGTLKRQPVSFSSSDIMCFRKFGDSITGELDFVQSGACTFYSVVLNNGAKSVVIDDGMSRNDPKLSILAIKNQCN